MWAIAYCTFLGLGVVDGLALSPKVVTGVEVDTRAVGDFYKFQNKQSGNYLVGGRHSASCNVAALSHDVAHCPHDDPTDDGFLWSVESDGRITNKKTGQSLYTQTGSKDVRLKTYVSGDAGFTWSFSSSDKKIKSVQFGTYLCADSWGENQRDTKVTVIDSTNSKKYGADIGYEWVEEKVPPGAFFDLDSHSGTGVIQDMLHFPHQAEFDPAASVSIVCWFKITSPANDKTQWIVTRGTKREGYSLGTNPTKNYWKVYVCVAPKTDKCTEEKVDFQGGSKLGLWTHLAFTFGNQEIKLYQNGVLVSSQAQVGEPLLYDSTDLWVGGEAVGLGAKSTTNDGDEPHKFLDGQISKLAIFSSELSASQINDIYTSQVGSHP